MIQFSLQHKALKCLLLILTIYSLPTFASDLRSDSIDVKSTLLKMDFSDFSSKIFHAEADISFQSKKNGVTTIQLDLLKLTVDSVIQNNQSLSFTYNDSTLTVPLLTLLNGGQTAAISVFYHGHPYQNAADFGGFYWTNLYAFNIGVSFIAEPHNYGRVWFPCFDNFIERSSFQYSITTDSTRKAFCNGNLDSTTLLTNGSKTWHWHINEPIPSYLACVAISDYATLMDTVKGMNGIVPIVLAARPGDTTRLKNSFVNLKNAFHIFEKLFDAYQFNKIGYSLVPFTAGAMEHATNIAYMLPLVTGTTQYESVMAHELSHHWFGDLVTCDNEGEMWLNEGWARYCESLFYENMYGRERYLQDLREAHEDVLRMEHAQDTSYWPLSNVPSKYTYNTQSVYEHGAIVAHTLRSYVGDNSFFTCIKDYLRQFAFKDVNSGKLDNQLGICGAGTGYFFLDWVSRPGFVDFSIADKRILPLGNNTYEVTLNIVQKKLHAPYYFHDVPVEVSFFDSTGNRVIKTASANGPCYQSTFTLNFSPAFIALDYDEKISDAITDEVRKVGSAGTYDFGTAKIILLPKTGTDSSLVRVEHHWVSPKNTGPEPAEYRLSDYRYWTVDGLWKDDFQTDARINYNGSTNQTNGYLDNTFITGSEDDLVLFYRPDRNTQWQLADSFKLFTSSNKTDKVGYFIVYNLKKGDYTLAMKDASITDETTPAAICNALGIQHLSPTGRPRFTAFPNPVNNDELTIEFSEAGYFTTCTAYDFIGRKVLGRAIRSDQSSLALDLRGLAEGVYSIQLNNKQGDSFAQKIVKTR